MPLDRPWVTAANYFMWLGVLSGNFAADYWFHRSCRLSKVAATMNIVYSEHAEQRFCERDGIAVSLAKIKRIGRLVDIDEEFHVSNVLHTFASKRISDVTVIVMTVMFNVSNKPKQPKQKRQTKYERLSRKSLPRGIHDFS